MALIDPCAFLGLAGNTYPAARLRRVVQLLAGSREGVLGASDLAVTQTGTPSLAVSVAAGAAIINGDDATRQGAYTVENDAAVTTAAITTPHATLPRIDRLVLEVLDQEGTGSGGGGRASDLPQLRIVAGTPGASPSAPAEPATAITLALIAVAAGATSIVNANLTDARTVLRMAPQWATADIADEAISWPKILAGTIVQSRLADAIIGTTKIVDGAVTTTKIVDGAVTTAKIADDAVTGAKLGLESGYLFSTSNSGSGSASPLAIPGLAVTPPAGTYLFLAQAGIQSEQGAWLQTSLRINLAGTPMTIAYGGAGELTVPRHNLAAHVVGVCNGSQQVTVSFTASVGNVPSGMATLTYVRIG